MINRAHELLLETPFTATKDVYADVSAMGAPAVEGPRVHDDAINALIAAGVARGGTTPTTFDPSRALTRERMASFLARSLEFLIDNGSGGATAAS